MRFLPTPSQVLTKPPTSSSRSNLYFIFYNVGHLGRTEKPNLYESHISTIKETSLPKLEYQNFTRGLKFPQLIVCKFFNTQIFHICTSD